MLPGSCLPPLGVSSAYPRDRGSRTAAPGRSSCLFFSASASSAFLSEDPARRPSSSSSSRPSERPTRPTPPRTSPRSSSLPRFRPSRSREPSLAPRGASRDPPRRARPPRRSSSRCRRSRERLLSRRRSRSRERERDLLLPPSRSRERDRPIRRRDRGCSERWGRRASPDDLCRLPFRRVPSQKPAAKPPAAAATLPDTASIERHTHRRSARRRRRTSRAHPTEVRILARDRARPVVGARRRPNAPAAASGGRDVSSEAGIYKKFSAAAAR